MKQPDNLWKPKAGGNLQGVVKSIEDEVEVLGKLERILTVTDWCGQNHHVKLDEYMNRFITREGFQAEDLISISYQGDEYKFSYLIYHRL